MLGRLKALLQDPPPSAAFEISEGGIAAARIAARTDVQFRALKQGTLSVSPLKENVTDPDDFALAVKTLAATVVPKKRRDVALILPDYSTRMAALDFDSFPYDPKEQLSLVRFRLKRTVPFDIDAAAVSYAAQTAANKKVDVVAAVAPLEIVARYEAPFRTAGLLPGLVTTSAFAALELAADGALTVMAKLAGRVLSLIVRRNGSVKLVRCLELPSTDLEEVAAVLAPTFVFVEDNYGERPQKLSLCGFGKRADSAERAFAAELDVETESLRSPLGVPGENNAGLLGYLRSISKYN
jgi:type IV pilus assembly protein PilM